MAASSFETDTTVRGRAEIIEVALAHVVCTPVAAAHARSDLFERRRLLMVEPACQRRLRHRLEASACPVQTQPGSG